MLFENYFGRVSEGSLDMVVASVESEVTGYVLIKTRSNYLPFAAAGIPEIADFSVLRNRQRAGIGTALMDEAERRVARFSSVVGLGVGLFSDYGTAQRMYVKRGYVPDGAGVVLDGVPVQQGTSIILNNDPELMFTKRLH
ncbi:GNAT family N-acetyltransferase [Microlunatus aurantiacus]|uniref:GNAT family N-acetyltransferase n=1 Tax=Microlunatus aurantiacus TaxID=446786 RepID=A0ABP7DG49_9ACTN